MHPRLPLDGGDRIVGIVMADTANATERSPTLHDFVSWRDALKSVPDLAAYRDRDWNVIVGNAAPEPVAVAEISAPRFGPSQETWRPPFKSRRSPASTRSLPQVPAR